MSEDTMKCRARVTPTCEHGTPEGVDDWREDGSYEEETDTVICDACYVALMRHTPSGLALRHELSDAIEKMRAA